MFAGQRMAVNAEWNNLKLNLNPWPKPEPTQVVSEKEGAFTSEIELLRMKLLVLQNAPSLSVFRVRGSFCSHQPGGER